MHFVHLTVNALVPNPRRLTTAENLGEHAAQVASSIVWAYRRLKNQEVGVNVRSYALHSVSAQLSFFLTIQIRGFKTHWENTFKRVSG